MAIKNADEIGNLVTKALEGVKRNLTDHVFWEIQRDTDLFREYISIISCNGSKIKDAVYRETHRKIATAIKQLANAKSAKPGKTGNSALNQTFTRFDPKTVKI